MRVVDLFCGCGGFSLGARQAGFSVPLAVDNNATLTSSHAHNFDQHEVLIADAAGIRGANLVERVGGNVDGVIGGPPCQGFSSIGKRYVKDPRRELVHHFFRLVSEIEPAFFVMENVAGLGFSGSRELLGEAMEQVGKKFEVTGPMVLDASEFGAATRRKRLFVVGVHRDRGVRFVEADLEEFKLPSVTVRDAIWDLRQPTYLGQRDAFEFWKADGRARVSEYAKSLRSSRGEFTGNAITQHSKAVVTRFKAVKQGGTDTVGRHPRLDWNGLCPTLRAGTGSENGSFQAVRPIHPEEPRVITVREAARLQGFPDEFRFHPTVWHSFRMIGNSVAPAQARAVLSAVRKRLNQTP